MANGPDHMIQLASRPEFEVAGEAEGGMKGRGNVDEKSPGGHAEGCTPQP